MVQANLSPQPPRQQAAFAIPQDRPVYRILSGKFFGPDDNLYPEGAIIAFNDEPNQEMEPLNALAEEKMKAYLKKLDDAGRAAAEKAGKSYTGLLDAYENARKIATDESKQVQLLGQQPMVPLMGAKKKDHGVQKIDAPQAAPLTGVNGKLSIKSDK